MRKYGGLKTYINGLGTDNLIAYDIEEPDLTYTEREELTFCNERVLPYTSQFNEYGHTTITNRCNTLSSSGSIIGENRYYYHTNHLGSVEGITDQIGTTVTMYEYDTYGTPTLTGYDVGNTRLFTGREYDSEVGLYFNRARYYSSELGRFISRDPIGIEDDINLYSYVANNPVNYVDRLGTEAKRLFVEAYDHYLTLEKDYSLNLMEWSLGYAQGCTIINTQSCSNKMKKIGDLRNELNVASNKAKNLHYERNKYNNKLPKNQREIKENEGWYKLSFKESVYHQYSAPDGLPNLKYVNIDGREVVFNFFGTTQIQDARDIGTYNFFNASDFDNHKKYDVEPYFLWGNSEEDTTNESQRYFQTKEYIMGEIFNIQ